MKIYMGTDMEGVAGIVSFAAQAYPDGKYYEQGKKLVTAEVNAAVEGLAKCGIEDVLVNDGHGAGAILFEELHPLAKLLHGRPGPARDVQIVVAKQYDAAIMIGQHAMAGAVNANLNHTQNSHTIEYYKLNNKLIGEIAQFALFFGALDIPLIFLSGDDAACREAEELIPELTTTFVKTGLSRNSAISLSADVARHQIREGIQKAVKKHQENPVPPLKWEGPFVLKKRFFHTDTADAAAAQPGAKRMDTLTVQYQSDNILDIIYR